MRRGKKVYSSRILEHNTTVVVRIITELAMTVSLEQTFLKASVSIHRLGMQQSTIFLHNRLTGRALPSCENVKCCFFFLL